MAIPESPIKRPFRISRSPLVWLGLFGAVFIVWSWVDSMHRMAGFGRLVEIREIHPPKDPNPPLKTRYMVFHGHSGGYLRATTLICSSASALRIDAIKHELWNSNYVPPGARWFPMPAIQREKPWLFPSGASYVGTTYLFPHWIFALIYLSIWAGVMDRSNRRAQRAARAWQRIVP
jgi:hypothetical protein